MVAHPHHLHHHTADATHRTSVSRQHSSQSVNGKESNETPISPRSEGQFTARLNEWAGGDGLHHVTAPGAMDDFRTAPKKLFVDQDAMKAKLRERMSKPAYDVTNFYYTTGRAQKIARSQTFELFTLAVIALNALWISIDTDLNGAETVMDAAWPFQVMENLFCAYFSWEWIVRFLSFKRKCNGLRDAWFIFDSILVSLMVVETWVMTLILVITGSSPTGGLGNASMMRMARLLRLTRMFRMVRLLRAMPELMILVRGMVAATRSVLFTLLLLLFILYIFAVLFRQMCDGTEIGDEWFYSVPTSMHTLLVYGTFMDDLARLAYDLQTKAPLMLIVFYSYVLLGSLTLLNMLIGVLCEVVTAVASTEKEAMTIAYVKEVLHEVLTNTGFDADKDGKIDKEEFLALLDNHAAIDLLQNVGVDVIGLIGFSDFLFEDEHGVAMNLTYDDMMKIILELRGTNAATVRDIVDLRKYVKQLMAAMDIKSELRHSVMNSCGVSSQASLGRRSMIPGDNVDNKGDLTGLDDRVDANSAPEELGQGACMAVTSSLASANLEPFSSEQLPAVIQTLLADTSTELKRWMKAELRLNFANVSHRSYCNGDGLFQERSVDKSLQAAAHSPYKPFVDSSPTQSMLNALDCIDINLHDAALHDGLADSAGGSPPSNDFEEGSLSTAGLSDLLVGFHEGTKAMQERLAHLMQKVESQDADLGSLMELHLTLGRTPASNRGASDSDDWTQLGDSNRPNLDSHGAQHEPSTIVQSAELLRSIRSTREEMQCSLKHVMQQADGQHRKFAVLTKRVISTHQLPPQLSSGGFTPRVAH